MGKITLDDLLLNSGALEYVPDSIFIGYGHLAVARPKTMVLDDIRNRERWEKAEAKQRRREERNRKLQERASDGT